MILNRNRSEAPRLQILMGAEPALRDAVADRAREEARPLLLESTTEPWRSWSGVRQLLAQCAEVLGEEEVQAILERHPGPARLVLDGWSPSSPEADDKPTAIGARIDSHLTHNWAVQAPAMSGWARLLEDLLRDRGFCLLVPFVNHLDWESLAVLKVLFRRPHTSWPRLVLGYDDSLVEPRFDARGIEWRVLPGYVRDAMVTFVALPGARACRVTGPGQEQGRPSEGTPNALPKVLPSWFEGGEAAVWERLTREGELDPGDCRQVVGAMETCFRRFGFTTALWLGVELFRRAPGFRGEEAARAHGIVALSAHNRQFSSKGNAVLGRFIADHLEAALAEEARPQVRCALLYRLAVAYGRRLGDLETAHRWARQAISEATVLEDGGLRYQVAWGHNILAYVRVRSKDAEDSRRAMQAAVDCVSEPLWRPDRRTAARSNLFADLALTRSLAIHNLAASEALCGNTEQAWHTLEKACRLEAEIEGSAKYWAQNPMRHLRQRHRPDLAMDYGRAGLEAAEADREASLQVLFRLMLADLSFRIGSASRSAEHYLSARRLALKMEPLRDDLPDLEFPTAASLEAAGDLDHAETLLRAKLEENGDPSHEQVAEAASRLAVLAARRNNPNEAESWASRASDAAALEGNRHCLVRTAVHIARAARLLGRNDEAIDLLRWALHLADTREDPDSISPADELQVLVELERCDALPQERLSRCIQLLPEALSSSSTWWSLGDLLKLWLRHDEPIEGDDPATEDATSDAARSSALRLLVSASESRADCQTLLPAAHERLHRLGIQERSEIAA